jgi:hypothetical protein
MKGQAPADQYPYGKWQSWEKVLAYLILAGIASASIWFVDYEAMRVQVEQGTTTPVR